MISPAQRRAWLIGKSTAPAIAKAEQRRKERNRTPPPRGKAFDSFNATATGHDWANAYLLMLVNNYIFPDQIGLPPAQYHNDHKFESAFKQKFRDELGMHRVEFPVASSGNADTEAVVMSNDDIVIVAFRGSESRDWASAIKDWLLTDFNIHLVEMSQFGTDVKVHQGFWLALEAVYDELYEMVEDHGGFKDKRLIVTGHSLGGALAKLFAIRVAAQHAGSSAQGGQPRIL